MVWHCFNQYRERGHVELFGEYGGYPAGGHEAMVSMVALGCGVALLPEVVLENSPEPVRNRVMILERSDEKTPFELGVCAQKKRLHEPLIDAFWQILPNP